MSRNKDFVLVDLLDQHATDESLKRAVRTEFRLMKSLAELLEGRLLKDIRNSDISANAGLSYGVLNHRFKDKKRLAARLADYFMRQLEEIILRDMEPYVDPYLRLLDENYFFLKCVENNRGLWRLLMDRSIGDKKLDSAVAGFFEFWVERRTGMLPARIAGRKIDKAQARVVGTILSNMADSVYMEIVEKGRRRDISSEDLAEWITILRYRALMGLDPGPAALKEGRRLILKPA